MQQSYQTKISCKPIISTCERALVPVLENLVYLSSYIKKQPKQEYNTKISFAEIFRQFMTKINLIIYYSYIYIQRFTNYTIRPIA